MIEVAAPSPPAQAPRWPGRPAWVEIDLDAVEGNVRRLRGWLGPQCALIAVVKADGYGLGAGPVARAALAGGAAGVAVASVDEGVLLRRAGLEGPIWIMGVVTQAEIASVVAARLTSTPTTETGARALAQAAHAAGITLPVHLKVDTGLTRFGRLPDEVVALAVEMATLPGLEIEGLWTHCADGEDTAFTRQQLRVFHATHQALAGRGIHPPILHVASSGPALALPETHLNCVRLGIVLSGHMPSPTLASPVLLAPAVTLHASIVRLTTLAAGDRVGYGHTYQAPGPRRVALVPWGYADGYSRSLSNRGVVLVGGQRCPVIGRVSMDQLTVDVSAVPGVAEGDPVVLAGTQGAEQITLDEIAQAAGTISYEVLTQLGRRLPRLYLRAGEVVETRSLLGSEEGQDAPG